MTKIFNAIVDFFLSDLYLYIFYGCLGALIGLLAVLKVIGFFIERRNSKEFVRLCDKYGIEDDYLAPGYVWVHIEYLIQLAECYELDSLYEAQDKFNELHASYWNNIKCSEETTRKLHSLNPGKREFFFRAFRHGKAIERKNNENEV